LVLGHKLGKRSVRHARNLLQLPSVGLELLKLRNELGGVHEPEPWLVAKSSTILFQSPAVISTGENTVAPVKFIAAEIPPTTGHRRSTTGQRIRACWAESCRLRSPSGLMENGNTQGSGQISATTV
jgi:hypothetical protein